ncbi:MAG TPA: transposase, partial [Desulfosarcina sp.]|nr:transposase [Desulfosarcina sp.]
IMGGGKAEWQDTDYVLRKFGATRRAARRRYEIFVEKGTDRDNRFDFNGGGLVRSAGGWSAVKALRRAQAYQKGDERILGDGDFLNKVLSASKERLERSCRLAAAGRDLDWLIERVAKLTGVAAEEVASPDKGHRVSRARSLLCFWATRELGISQTELAERLQLKQPAVSQAARRGRRLEVEEGYSIEPK